MKCCKNGCYYNSVMRKKRPFIIHNLSQGTSVVAYGVEETASYIRSKGCRMNNNEFNEAVNSMNDEWQGMTFTGADDNVYEIDVLWTV